MILSPLRNCIYSAIFFGRTKVWSTLVIRGSVNLQTWQDATLSSKTNTWPSPHASYLFILPRLHYITSNVTFVPPKPPANYRYPALSASNHQLQHSRTHCNFAPSPLGKHANFNRTCCTTLCRLKRTWPVRTFESAFVLSRLGKDYSKVSAWQLPAPALDILLVCMALSLASPIHTHHLVTLGTTEPTSEVLPQVERLNKLVLQETAQRLLGRTGIK